MIVRTASVEVSTLEIVFAPLLATQIEPSAKATLPGGAPTETWLSTDPSSGSRRTRVGEL